MSQVAIYTAWQAEASASLAAGMRNQVSNMLHPSPLYVLQLTSESWPLALGRFHQHSADTRNFQVGPLHLNAARSLLAALGSCSQHCSLQCPQSPTCTCEILQRIPPSQSCTLALLWVAAFKSCTLRRKPVHEKIFVEPEQRLKGLTFSPCHIMSQDDVHTLAHDEAAPVNICWYWGSPCDQGMGLRPASPAPANDQKTVSLLSCLSDQCRGSLWIWSSWLIFHWITQLIGTSGMG